MTSRPQTNNMSDFRKNFEQVWDQLRQQQAKRQEVLDEIRIDGLRGINDLTIRLPFPVTVLAGPNGSGKSTVLFALAAAYRDPSEATARRFSPSVLFPDFRPTHQSDGLSDVPSRASIEFSYVSRNARMQMKWSRGAGNWNRSFLGRQRGSQPERDLYVRTLANLSNPSEVRSFLQLARRPFSPAEIDASQIAFAQRILAFRYGQLHTLTSVKRNLLFAQRLSDEPASSPLSYSEFHMSSGERAILRLSIEISKRPKALVLIDEVETGLHPFVQQMLMLELHRLALRNEIQVVVTTHSPVVLDAVPPEARVFLDRQAERVVVREPYRDIIQKSLYGQTQDRLSVLCEDEAGEAMIRGFMDALSPQIDLLQNDLEIGRDTGKTEFPQHMKTLARFQRLDSVLFVLDGDGADVAAVMRAEASKSGQAVQVILLPGTAPESWALERVEQAAEEFASGFGLTTESLRTQIREVKSLFASATDKPRNITHNMFEAFAAKLSRSPADVIRFVAAQEARAQRGAAFDAVNRLREAIQHWRSRGRG